MPGISIHCVDVARGIVAAGMRVDLLVLEANGGARTIATGRLSPSGVLQDPALGQTFEPGNYEARFHVAEYYRSIEQALPPMPFLDLITYRFGLADPQAHYHLPMKFTPWGYSCFRGGA